MQDLKRQHGFGLFHILIILIVSLAIFLGVSAYRKSSAKSIETAPVKAGGPAGMSESSEKTRSPNPSSKADSALIERALKAVRGIMKDPSAAQFEGLKIGQRDAVCGSVNGKNSYGGYVGFRPFIVLNDGEVRVMPAALDNDMTEEQMEKINRITRAIQNLCP